MAITDEKSVDQLTQGDWSQLEDWELERVLQQSVAHMAVAQATIREETPAFYRHMAAKQDYANWNGIVKGLQSLIRSKRPA